MFLFKLWIFDINFTSIIFFLTGIVFGAILICLIYLFLVLISLRDYNTVIKVQNDDLSTEKLMELINGAKAQYKDKSLRKDKGKVVHCKELCTDLVYSIAANYFPNSKYPMLEISVNETLEMIKYIEARIEELLDRKAVRLLKKLKISSIVSMTKKSNVILNSKAVEIGKEISERASIFKKIINAVNPAWWFKKTVVDKTLDVVIDKICLIVISIVGEEAYKIYSKKLFTLDNEDELNELDEACNEALAEYKDPIYDGKKLEYVCLNCGSLSYDTFFSKDMRVMNKCDYETGYMKENGGKK